MASGSSIDVAGFDQLQRELSRLKSGAPMAAAQLVYQEAEEIMTDSKENYVPVDQGPLRESGHVGKPVVSIGSVSVDMGFGGAAAPYALYVHEIPPPEVGAPNSEQWAPGTRTAKHTNGQWKYLQRPLEAAAKTMMNRWADRLRKAIIK